MAEKTKAKAKASAKTKAGVKAKPKAGIKAKADVKLKTEAGMKTEAAAGAKAKAQDKKPHYHGHRQRAKTRLMKTGGAGLEDYELLENLLFLIHPRRDTKGMAKELLHNFDNDIASVLGAQTDALKQADGIGEHGAWVIQLINALARRVGQSKIMHRNVMSSWDDLKAYCRTMMVDQTIETFHAIYLDTRRAVITDERISEGTVNHTPVYPREIIRRALAVGASGIVIVHNHPSGDPKPSRSDIDITIQIRDVCNGLGLNLHDHLIVARKEVVSFKRLGLL